MEILSQVWAYESQVQFDVVQSRFDRFVKRAPTQVIRHPLPAYIPDLVTLPLIQICHSQAIICPIVSFRIMLLCDII